MASTRSLIRALTQVRDMALGLDFMHSLGATHGDLKPVGTPLFELNLISWLIHQPNVLVNREGTACLSDFGITTLNSETHTRCAEERGSARYMAPERLIAVPGQSQSPTATADVYGLAFVIWEVSIREAPVSDVDFSQVFAGEMAFRTEHDYSVINLVFSGRRPDRLEGAEPLGFSPEIWDALQQCWMHDSHARVKGMRSLFQILGITPNTREYCDEVFPPCKLRRGSPA
jgi:serine/threonine protein kinase